jgi:hypothetical protein
MARSEREENSLNRDSCKNFNIYQVVIFLTALSVSEREKKTTRVNGRSFSFEAPQRFVFFFTVNLDDDATFTADN